MTVNKNQHYVPQFYMQLFADSNGRFNILNVENGEEYNCVPYKGQCQKDYFYGKDLVFENKFKNLENIWKHLFDKLIKGEELNTDDVRRIKQFAVLQRERTMAASEYCDEVKQIQMIEYMKMLCENKHIPASQEQIKEIVEEKMKGQREVPSLSLQHAEELIPYIDDLNLLIITYNTEEELLSSDAPVVCVNKFVEGHVGYATAGFVSFFPICKNKIAVIYDAKMYTRYRDNLYIESDDEKEVKILNEYQLINAGNIMFGCQNDIKKYYTTEVIELRKKNRSRPSVQSFGTTSNKLLAHKPRLSIYPCSLSFATLNHDARRVPEIGRDFLTRTMDEKYIERMQFREYGLIHIDKIHGKRTAEEQKQFRRAVRRMNQYVYRYWERPTPKQVLN